MCFQLHHTVSNETIINLYEYFSTICKIVLLSLIADVEDKNGRWPLGVERKNHNKTQSLGTYTLCRDYGIVCLSQRICANETAMEK